MKFSKCLIVDFRLKVVDGLTNSNKRIVCYNYTININNNKNISRATFRDED